MKKATITADADKRYYNNNDIINNDIVLITNGKNLDQLYYKGNIIGTLGENVNTPIASDFLIVA
ncbi:MAG: hypothetical protein ACRC2J_10040 [Microcoleaceae cyanobacterium]